jgi:NAD(P)-dependent dehydrogenase (short-subunit alcohol dehydrogenase family)
MIEFESLKAADQVFRRDGKAGGYGGIGEAVCRGPASVGAEVAVTGSNLERIHASAKKLRDEGCEAHATSGVTEANVDYVLDVNLEGTMFRAQAGARLCSRLWARGGMTTLCKQLAAEWAQHKFNLNLLAPAFVRTPRSARRLEDPEFSRNLMAPIPMGRIAETEDVLGAVLPASDFIAAQTLFLDGAITATQLVEGIGWRES